jgi:hypothetical protein
VVMAVAMGVLMDGHAGNLPRRMPIDHAPRSASWIA